MYCASVRVQSTAMSLSVCESVCPHAYLSETTSPNFTKFMCLLHMAVDWSSSGSIIMFCTSGFVDDVMLPMAE